MSIPLRTVKPVIYLAGKIAPHDWREKLIGDVVELDCDDEGKLFDARYIDETTGTIFWQRSPRWGATV